MSNEERLLAQFFIYPTKSFHLRELARLAHIAPPSTKTYLERFIKKRWIERIDTDLYPTYRACRENDAFKRSKKYALIFLLHETGLIESIAKKARPDAIILFGSSSRGEDIEKSDIDLAVFSGNIPLHMQTYESRFHRRINVFFVKDFGKLSKELKNNLLNGVIVHGYVEVF